VRFVKVFLILCLVMGLPGNARANPEAGEPDPAFFILAGCCLLSIPAGCLGGFLFFKTRSRPTFNPSTEGSMVTWINKPLGDLLTTWGSPDTVLSGGENTWVVIYMRDYTLVCPEDPGHHAEVLPTIDLFGDPGNLALYAEDTRAKLAPCRLFFVDERGVIQRVDWENKR